MIEEKFCVFNMTEEFDQPLISQCSNCGNELVWDSSGGPEESGYKYCPGCGAKIVRFFSKTDTE
jgi:DNA-directed RNA polymerase subunit RPC12/RpoP